MQTLVKGKHSLHQAVLDELRWDRHVDETEIGVEADDGVVTLTGTVESLAKKMAAVAAVHRVPGVRDVADEISVRVPGAKVRTDQEVAAAVRTALEWDAILPHENIGTTVQDGWVTLLGSVPAYTDKMRAARIVAELWGVRGVTNKLNITEPLVDAQRIRLDLEVVLERRAEREARRINVDVQNGHVDLSGGVHSWAERSSILSAVEHTPGVREVRDFLFIDHEL